MCLYGSGKASQQASKPRYFCPGQVEPNPNCHLNASTWGITVPKTQGGFFSSVMQSRESAFITGLQNHSLFCLLSFSFHQTCTLGFPVDQLQQRVPLSHSSPSATSSVCNPRAKHTLLENRCGIESVYGEKSLEPRSAIPSYYQGIGQKADANFSLSFQDKMYLTNRGTAWKKMCPQQLSVTFPPSSPGMECKVFGALQFTRLTVEFASAGNIHPIFIAEAHIQKAMHMLISPVQAFRGQNRI